MRYRAIGNNGSSGVILIARRAFLLIVRFFLAMLPALPLTFQKELDEQKQVAK